MRGRVEPTADTGRAGVHGVEHELLEGLAVARDCDGRREELHGAVVEFAQARHRGGGRGGRAPRTEAKRRMQNAAKGKRVLPEKFCEDDESGL